MNGPTRDTCCPHSRRETRVERGERSRAPGGLPLHEFETLVRNEWRGLLGPGAYDRAHDVRLLRTLTRIVMGGPAPGLDRELQDEIDGLVADIAATGRGRDAVRAEIATLLQAVHLVLRRANAEREGIQRFVTAARRTLLRELGYPSDAESDRGSDTFAA